jgi:hypothetical protein
MNAGSASDGFRELIFAGENNVSVNLLLEAFLLV